MKYRLVNRKSRHGNTCSTVIISILLLSVICSFYIIRRFSDLMGKLNQHNFKKNDSSTQFSMPKSFPGKKLPFDQVYETRGIGTYSRQFSGNYSKGIKTILLWTTWNSVSKTINYYFLRPGNKPFLRYGCPMSNCVAIHDRSLISKADAVLFHLLDVKVHDFPEYRRPDQMWILYNMEPPWLIERENSHLESLDGIFNLSMGYRSNLDIVVKYGFIDKNNAPQHTASDLGDIWNKKTRSVIWIASDCNTDSRREDYVRVLRKYIDVDTYGMCGEKKCFPSQSATCYEKLLVRYKFYLSFENAICQDYVTEKFFNIFNYDIVPVVFGGADYSKIAPPGSYIEANKFPNPQDLAIEMIRIGADVNLYANYLKQKSSYEAFLDPWTCSLCEKLHTPSTLSKIENMKKWWISDSHCKRWNLTNNMFQ